MTGTTASVEAPPPSCVLRTDGAILIWNRQWGAHGDIPFAGDLNSDGRFDDLGVWRTSEATWHAARSNGSIIVAGFRWGEPRG
jgi:hypothetical protein